MVPGRLNRPAPSNRARPKPASGGGKGIWIAVAAGAVILVIAVVLLMRPSAAAPPADPPVAKRTAPPPPPPPAPPPKIVEVVDPGPEGVAERIPWLSRRQAKAPNERKKWHGEWAALLPKTAGTAHEQTVRDELERLEGAGHKDFRERFRPVRERIKELIEARQARQAIQAIRDWKMPPDLDLKGDIQADLDREIVRLGTIADLDDLIARLHLEFKEGKDPGDPKAALASFLASPDIGIRVPAEYGLRSLVVPHVAHTFRKLMDGRRAAAETRIEELLKGMGEEEAGRKRRLEAWERRLKENTQKAPLPAKALGLSGGMTFKILKFDGANLTYGNASVEMATSFAELSPASLGQILELAVDPADADGLIEAGRMAVRAGALDSADRLIRGAIRARPSYEPLAPSVERIRRGVGTLRAKADIVGDRVSIAYAFDKPDEVEDFKVLGDGAREISGGALRLRGEGSFIADASNVEFSGRLWMKLRTGAKEGPSAYVFGFRWEPGPGESDLLLVAIFDSGCRIILVENGEAGKPLHEGALTGKPAEFDLEFAEGRVEFRAGGKPIWSGRAVPDGEVRPIIGGTATEPKTKATVSYASVELAGRAAPEWIRSIRSERRALVETELAKELKVLAAAKPPRGAGSRLFGRKLDVPLPIEEDLGDAFTEDARKAMAAWRAALGKLLTARGPLEFDRHARLVEETLDAFVASAPWLPLTYYYRAEWKYVRGDLPGAIADLDLALARHGSFVEAHVAKSELHRRLRKYAEAGVSTEAALAAVPDLARPRLNRAILHYYADRFDDAVKELGLAMRLAPEDLTLRLDALRLARIIEGPRWPSALEIDTEHYLFKAELAAASPKEVAAAKERAQRAARTLGITRKWFEEIVPGRGKRMRRPIVYLFQSPESYYVHADLAHGDRLEHSVGVFFPEYQQMMFFLGGGSEEEAISTMIHESFHEYFASLAGATPPWLNEGYAEYVSGVRIEGDRVVESGLKLPERVPTLKRMLKRNSMGIPFRVIMTETQSQFMAFQPGLQYAQSWSMVHFMHHFDGGRYKPKFTAYVNSLIDGKSPGEALQAFDGIDLEEMQKEWLGYIKTW